MGTTLVVQFRPTLKRVGSLSSSGLIKVRLVESPFIYHVEEMRAG